MSELSTPKLPSMFDALIPIFSLVVMLATAVTYFGDNSSYGPNQIALLVAMGIAIIIGFKGKLSAFILAGLTLVISIYMHDFWTMAEGLARTHETQNFFKNMGIMAGLLMVSSIGTGWLSLDNRITHKP